MQEITSNTYCEQFVWQMFNEVQLDYEQYRRSFIGARIFSDIILFHLIHDANNVLVHLI